MNLAFIFGFWSALVAVGVALSVAVQARRSIPRWSFAIGMGLLAVESFCSGFGTDAILPETLVQWQSISLFALALLPGAWLLFTLTYARGNPSEFVRRWRGILLIAFLVPLGIAVVFHQQLIFAVAAPVPGQWLLQLGTPGRALHVILLLSAVLVLMNLERTFRAAVGTMRWRIKFMVLGLGALFAVRAYTSSQFLLFPVVDVSLLALNCGALLVGCLLVGRSLLRTGHFEVSVFPSHSVLHNSFTLLLAGIYLIVLGAFAKAVSFFGGGAAFEFKAFLVLVALVLLTLILMSDRVRVYSQRFISRHFQRPIYDYRRVWRTVTDATARRVEQNELCSSVVKLASDIFQALSVTIWLVDERRERLIFAASSSLSELKAGQLELEPADTSEIILALNQHPEPFDLDSSKELWAAALRRSHPEEFRKGGNRLCAPLIAGGELLGIVTLGDRIGGIPFVAQDLDLLKSVSDQAAACLLNIQLSQRLSQSKQLEAFQAMSAFFVHDLKNTASTLSLMLKNFPVHYQDPAFREDALRGISKTVTHINELISRLTVLRHELVVRPIECDLNQLVLDALKAHDQAPDVEFVKELRPLPRLALDPAQIEKVVTNLLLNAREAALSKPSQIRLETSQRNGCVVLAVTDNGCGMAPEFVRNSLFRPFQTTKQKGIGIGMFHCKMIVEAHRGKIEVESEPGKGTTFRVLLPTGSGIM